MFKPILCLAAMLMLGPVLRADEPAQPTGTPQKEQARPLSGAPSENDTEDKTGAPAAPAKPADVRGPDLARQDRPLSGRQEPGELIIQANSPPGPAPGAPAAKPKRRADFLLAPIPFSNATTGAGLCLVTGLVYPFHQSDTVSPPSITAVMGFYAENGSWGGGLLQRIYLHEDRYRFMAGAAYLDVNWDYVINQDAGDTGGFSVPLNQEDFLATGEFLVRLAPHIYLGPTFRYLDLKTSVRREDLPEPGPGGDPDPPTGQDFELEQRTVALGFHFEWDTRDNTFYPRTGHWMDVLGFFFRDTWGSDYDYDVYQAYYNGYRGFRGKNVLAYQILGRFTRGDTPFFSLSSMNLRGYAFGGYMDNLMATAQVEYRREIGWRVGAVAFAGVGEVSPSWSAFSWDHLLPSYGAGLRFRLTKNNPINLRVDMAFTKDGHHLTMFVGEAF